MAGTRFLKLLLLTGLVCVSGRAQSLSVRGEPVIQDPSVEELLARANASMHGGDLEGTINIVQEVLSRDGANKAARQMLIEALIRKARWVDAEAQAVLFSKRY